MNARWFALLPGLVLFAAHADESNALSKAEVAAKLNGVKPSQIADSPLPGFYQVAVGSDVAYVSTDGRYVFEGDLYDLKDSVNLTESARAAGRVGLLKSIDRDKMIIFGPKDGQVKHRVMVFTDVDCGYCRQFHRDIDKVTALGIEVDYLSYPRTGPDTASWAKAEHVWCAKDRNTALTEAKLGGAVPDTTCDSNPVEEEYHLGQLVGVRGTPAIFAENGEMLGGYLTPKQLLGLLEQQDPD